jgi:DNA-binding IclR family transcriptional regulator
LDLKPGSTPDATPLTALIPKVRVILQAFEQQPAILGVSEIARRCLLPKTTVHRLVHELADSGFLVRDGTGYRLGPWLFELGQHVSSHRSLRLMAAPYLEDLSRATGETVMLGLPGNGEVLFAEKYVGARGRGQVVTQVEGRVPLHCGASGKVVLAYGDAEQLAAVIATGLPARTPFTVTDPDRLRREVVIVQEQGYAVDREELVVGYGAVAAPVFRKDALAATLIVVAPISRLSVSRFAPAVCTAARGLTRAVSARAGA